MSRQNAIRADFNSSSLVVYQAYNDAIADTAIGANRFVSPFSTQRMTWIKPSFLWLMRHKISGPRTMPLHSDEDDLIRDLLEQANTETRQESISSFATEWGFSLGCFAGPLLGFALLVLLSFLRPDSPAGGPGGLLIFLGMAAVVGSLIGSQLIPFLLRRRK